MTGKREHIEGAGCPRNLQHRLNININELTKAHLSEVAAIRQSSITDAVRVLIGIGHFIWRAHKDGRTILLEKNGDTDRVIFDF